jgi:hypothetical protein
MIPLPGDAEVKDLVEAVQQHPRLQHAISVRHRVPRYLEATL